MLLRNSELDRRLNCPGSFVDEGQIAYSEQNEMARSGTAGHHGLALAVADDFSTPDSAAADAAERFGVDPEDMRRVVFQGREIWEDIKHHFPSPQPEYKVTGRASQGTSDLVSVYAGALLDWKTGYGMVEHPNQLLGYADGLVQKFGMPERGYVIGIEAWVRFGTYRLHKITQSRLDQFVMDVEKAASTKSYSAGPWCSFCPLRTECDARMQMARASIGSLGVNEMDGHVVMTPKDIGAIWERRGIIKKAVDDLEKLTKQLLREGTEINLPDGRKLGLSEQSRRKLDAATVYDVLTGGDFDMSHGDALDAIGSATAKTINEVVGSHAAKGEKGRDRARAMALIEESDGVTVSVSHRISIFDEGETP
jgi:hypothetical protein